MPSASGAYLTVRTCAPQSTAPSPDAGILRHPRFVPTWLCATALRSQRPLPRRWHSPTDTRRLRLRGFRQLETPQIKQPCVRARRLHGALLLCPRFNGATKGGAATYPRRRRARTRDGQRHPRRRAPPQPRRGRRARRGGGAERDARARAPAADMRQRARGAAQQRRLRVRRRDLLARVQRRLRARRRNVLQLLPAGLRGTGLRRGRVQPGLVVHAHTRALHLAVPRVWRRRLRLQLHLPDAPAGGVCVLHVRLCACVQRGFFRHGGPLELRRRAAHAATQRQRNGQRLSDEQRPS